MNFSKRARVALLLACVVATGLAACAEEDSGSKAAVPTTGSSARAASDRAFQKCLTRAGARAVSSRADLRFLEGSSTESGGSSAITNGTVSSGPGGTDV